MAFFGDRAAQLRAVSLENASRLHYAKRFILVVFQKYATWYTIIQCALLAEVRPPKSVIVLEISA